MHTDSLVRLVSVTELAHQQNQHQPPIDTSSSFENIPTPQQDDSLSLIPSSQVQSSEDKHRPLKNVKAFTYSPHFFTANSQSQQSMSSILPRTMSRQKQIQNEVVMIEIVIPKRNHQ
jgi:hypothetical protein